MIKPLGRITLGVVAEVGDVARFASWSFLAAIGAPRIGRRLVRAIHEQGVRCVPVVLIIGAFTGLVLGLQGYHILSRFGGEAYLGPLVSLTLTRELGPVLAALMVVGQAGSAQAAEIGIQRNSEQIDALETMGIDPRRYLVAPRLLASIFVFPIHAAAFCLIGILGGYLSGSVLLPLEDGIYWSSVLRSIGPADIQECFTKAIAFGVITTVICCHNGFNAHRRPGLTGAQAVGASTTRAVVLSCISVLATDYVITSALI